MDDADVLAHPVGWWLKEADARLNAVFDRALDGTGVDRRGWQVLSSLAERPMSQVELAASLASFDTLAAVGTVIKELEGHGWIEKDGDTLRLTAEGQRAHADLQPRVAQVRARVQQALPRDD